jgi:threonine/homoserine/homoserine lactone efflux protein
VRQAALEQGRYGRDTGRKRERIIDSQVVAFVLVAAALPPTPSADTLLVLRNVLRGGRRAGVITTLSICSGLFVRAALSALGVSVILMRSATAFHVVISLHGVEISPPA